MWTQNLNLLSAYMVMIASAIMLVVVPSLFFVQQIRELDSKYKAILAKEYNWLTWPAVATNYFFARLFGKAEIHYSKLFTWRSVSVTFLFSFLANVICLFLILTNIPADAPKFDLNILKILGLSYFTFIAFNFMGDLISINITRKMVYRIATGKCNFLRYIGYVILGICLGYSVTLLPTIFVISYCLFFSEPLNNWAHTGLLGNALIPFFLFIFATTNMPIAFSFFAMLAVFSVTIPTAIYISFMMICYVNKMAYVLYRKNTGIETIENLLNSLKLIATLLFFIASILASFSLFPGQ